MFGVPTDEFTALAYKINKFLEHAKTLRPQNGLLSRRYVFIKRLHGLCSKTRRPQLRDDCRKPAVHHHTQGISTVLMVLQPN